MFLGCTASLWAQPNHPVAHPDAVVTAGKARFTVLTPEMIRIQYSEKGLFEDRATFAVVNRRLPVPQFTQEQKDGYLYIKTNALTLKYKIGGKLNANANESGADVLSISMQLNGRPVLWYPGKDDLLNLKGTTRTLDGQIGDNKRQEMENGLLSRAGWSVIDESPLTRRGDGSTTFAFEGQQDGIEWVAEPVDKQAIDWYFMGYGHEYKKALGDFIKIAGRMPMPPLYVLGYWYSKYQRYTSDEFMEIVNDVKRNQIPMDVMIFDMDWHTQGWTGWTWDSTAIPDPVGLINWMHDNGLKVSLNLHPADGVDDDEDFFQELRSDMGLGSDVKVVPWNLSDKKFYHNMFNRIIRAREQQGVDFWWLDWQQNLTSKYVDGLGETFWCNHVFYNDMRLNRPNHRPLIFHRWGGLGSHRYPLGFSGDTHIRWEVLGFLPYFTATASNVGYGYWGHDLGGHMQRGQIPTDPELYTRWLQYGVFSPLFKTHCTSSAIIERRFWAFEDHYEYMRDAVELRYALSPYIYDMAREAYDTGVSLCRPMYYEYPEDEKAYTWKEQYFFGDNILAATVCEPLDSLSGKANRSVWLPAGNDWYDMAHKQTLKGGQTRNLQYTIGEIAWFVKAGAIIPLAAEGIQNLQEKSNALRIYIAPGTGKSTYTHYEDDEVSQAYPDSYATTLITKSATGSGCTVDIAARQGSYKGMAADRDLTIVLGGLSHKPSATLGGAALECKWDAETKEASIKLPVQSANTPARVTVKY
jgi:alpha-glucosidase (family GH31 glycosyl hydrolase)